MVSTPTRFYLKYAQEVDTHLICSICLLPYFNPLSTTTECRHTFCHDCILLRLTFVGQCPIDETPLEIDDLEAANPIISSLVNQLLVNCPNEANGCPEQIERWALPSHLEECLNANLVCQEPSCSIQLTRHAMRVHHLRHHVLERPCTVTAIERPSFIAGGSKGDDEDELTVIRSQRYPPAIMTSNRSMASGVEGAPSSPALSDSRSSSIWSVGEGAGGPSRSTGEEEGEEEEVEGPVTPREFSKRLAELGSYDPLARMQDELNSVGPFMPPPLSVVLPEGQVSGDERYICRVEAIYDYTAVRRGELSFQAGDIIGVQVQHENGWWEGEKLSGEEGTSLWDVEPERGLFPRNYVLEQLVLDNELRLDESVYMQTGFGIRGSEELQERRMGRPRSVSTPILSNSRTQTPGSSSRNRRASTSQADEVDYSDWPEGYLFLVEALSNHTAVHPLECDFEAGDILAVTHMLDPKFGGDEYYEGFVVDDRRRQDWMGRKMLVREKVVRV